MSNFSKNLKFARGNLVFLTGLTLAFAIVVLLERWDSASLFAPTTPKIAVSALSDFSSETNELTDSQIAWGKIAWKYFENNTVEETGLVNSVDGYPASTLWDTASYLLGLISAQRLGIVEDIEFRSRMNRALSTLSEIDLFDDQLPNKSYNTQTTKMVTYDNSETERGIGWSAIDIGRIMVPFNILVWYYPEFTPRIEKILSHWDLDRIESGAEMMGADVDESGNTVYLQEGRLGYEEYASKSLVLIGMDLSRALDYELYMDFEDIYGIDIGTDLRVPEKFTALNMVVSEPYILDGMEFGFDEKSRELASRIYNVQQSRYEDTGILTAVSEDNIDQEPHFVYNTVFSNGKAWNAVTESGEDASEFRSLSTKAVFGLHSIFRTEYTKQLIDHIKDNYDPEKGWYSGIYESDGRSNTAITANTNGIILEALHHMQFGPFLSIHRGGSEQFVDVGDSVNGNQSAGTSVTDGIGKTKSFGIVSGNFNYQIFTQDLTSEETDFETIMAETLVD